MVTNFGLELVFPWSQILVWDFWFGIFFGDVTAVVTNVAVRFSYVRIRRDMWQGGAVSGKWALISSRVGVGAARDAKEECRTDSPLFPLMYSSCMGFRI